MLMNGTLGPPRKQGPEQKRWLGLRGLVAGQRRETDVTDEVAEQKSRAACPCPRPRPLSSGNAGSARCRDSASPAVSGGASSQRAPPPSARGLQPRCMPAARLPSQNQPSFGYLYPPIPGLPSAA